MGVKSYKETRVYKLAFEVAMEIFEISKSFPKEETYSLTDQIRRSSRSVCANIAEAYRKKLYPILFQKPRMQTQKIVKPVLGLIFQLLADM